jgi:HEAT repeat protein
VTILGQCGSHGVPVLIHVFQDRGESAEVRGFAALALGLSDDKRAHGPLTEVFLRGDADPLSYEAAEALGYARHTGPLIAALGHKEAYMRGTAAKVLGLCLCSEAVEPLKALLNDRDESVREAAGDAIRRIKRGKEAYEKWQAAGGKREDIPKFFGKPSGEKQ